MVGRAARAFYHPVLTVTRPVDRGACSGAQDGTRVQGDKLLKGRRHARWVLRPSTLPKNRAVWCRNRLEIRMTYITTRPMLIGNVCAVCPFLQIGEDGLLPREVSRIMTLLISHDK